MNSLPSAWARVSLATACALVSVPTLVGCELVAGLQKRQLSTIGDGGASTDTSASGLDGCNYAGTGTGSLRFANLVPNADAYDVCLKPSTAASFADVKPFFAGAGPACRAGLSYKTVTTSIAVPAGQYEVHVIRAGGKCEDQPIASLGTALVNDREPTSLYVLDAGGGAATVRRFVESRADRPSLAPLGFVHAASTLGALDLGVTASTTWAAPADILYLKGASFGAVPSTGGAGNLDANGYASQQTGASNFRYQVQTSDPQKTVGSITRKVDSGGTFVFIVAGVDGSVDYPIEFFACDETKGTGVLANCSDAKPLDVTVDAVNVQLSGPFAGAEQARRPAVIDAVGKLTSDVVCVTEAYQDADKEALIAAAKARYPYAYYEKTVETTVPPDWAQLDWDEKTVPPTPPPSCPNVKDKMEALVSCMRDRCSTKPGVLSSDKTTVVTPGGEDGVAIPEPSACLQGCASQVLAFVHSGATADETGCWGCVFSQYNGYEKMSDIRDRCLNKPRGSVGFRGMNGALVLSRFPIDKSEFLTLPYLSAWQAGVAKTRVTVDNGATFDFYCATPSGTSSDCTLFPGIGPYSTIPNEPAPKDCIEASVNQQKMHLKRLKQWIGMTSDVSHSPMMVTGDFYTGPAYGGTVAGVNEGNFHYLTDNFFSIGTAPGYVPECTRCPADNPLLGNSTSALGDWTRFNLLRNISIANVRSTKVFLKDPIVSATFNGNQVDVPIGVYYGLRSVVRIAP